MYNTYISYIFLITIYIYLTIFLNIVCDLGPLLVSTNTLNQKTLYKMLTKTTEFYITYAMGGHSIIQVKCFSNF